MRKVYVDSDHLEYIGYQKEESTIEIKYQNGNVYHYYNVPYEVYEEIIHSDSIEDARLKLLVYDDKYEYEKIW